MSAKTSLVFFLLLASSAQVAFAQQAPQKDTVHWCSTIPIADVWREAQFTAIFAFEVDPNGKPIHIKGVRMPLIKDDGPFISCISSWSIPSATGKVTAEFRWKWRCLDIGISANGDHLTYPC